MAADYSRVHRLLRIFVLVQSSDGWTAPGLAEELGVTERTIFRDMNAMQDAGIPIEFDKETKGYRVRRDFFMPPVALTFDEALAVVALGEHVGGQLPLVQAAGRAIEKIRSQLPWKVREELGRLDEHLHIKLASVGPLDGFERVYEEVRRAILDRRTLQCIYRSIQATLGEASDGSTGREEFAFRPYALFFGQRAWYVVGHHCGRDAVRTLKLNRFQKVERTDVPYVIPSDFTLQSYLGNAWRMIRGEPTYDVELRFDAEFAETVAETQWHATQRIDWESDGGITFRCQVDGLDEIVWWVLGMGPRCHVLQPPELAERVRAEAVAIAAAYEPPTG